MKIYQVYNGYTNKHNFQSYDLEGTYLSKDKALEHANQIVEKLKDEQPKECDWYIGKDYCFKTWDVIDWDTVTICKVEEIEVIE